MNRAANVKECKLLPLRDSRHLKDQMSLNVTVDLFLTQLSYYSVLFSDTMQTSARLSPSVTRRWTQLWQNSLVYIIIYCYPVCWSNFWTHSLFQDSGISFWVVAQRLDVEFKIRYEWQTMQIYQFPTCDACSSFHVYLPKQNYTAEVNCLVALHELYKYINKYYDQVSINKEKKQQFSCMGCGIDYL